MGKFESFNHAKDGYEHHDKLLDEQREILTHLGTPDGAVDGDLLVPPDAEAPDGVPRLGEDGGLPGQGLQHLAGAGQSVTGLSHADVQAQLPDLQLPHGVLGLVSAHSGSERVMFHVTAIVVTYFISL